MVVAKSQYVTLVEVPNDIDPDITLPDVNLEDGCVDDLRKGKNPIFTTIVSPGERGMAVLLVQCDWFANAFVQEGCKKVEQTISDCVGEDRYVLTYVDECNRYMIETMEKYKDPFEPLHGSFNTECYECPFTLKWYKDDTQQVRIC